MWGIKQRKSAACIDGPSERIMLPVPWHFYGAVLFETRREARDFIKEKFGYMATRADLRRHPHGDLMPLPVKVKLSIAEVEV